MEIIGHCLGFIAIGLFFISYQVFDKKKLVAIQTVGTVLNCLQYLLIGAFSGFTLNFVCIFRNFIYYYRDKRNSNGFLVPLLLAAVLASTALFSWEGEHSLLIIVGLMINTVCMGITNAQNLRKSIILTCAMIFIYNVIEGSYSGMVNESLSWVSALIGIIRYNKSIKQKS